MNEPEVDDFYRLEALPLYQNKYYTVIYSLKKENVPKRNYQQ